MRIGLWNAIAIALAVSIAGCGTSPTGGGTSSGGKDETFTVDKVALPTMVKQGSSGDVTIKLNRGKDFKQSVKLTAENVPDKVKVEFAPATVKPENEAKSLMKISADNTAAIGKYTIRVKATPEKGDATTIDVAVEVDKP